METNDTFLSTILYDNLPIYIFISFIFIIISIFLYIKLAFPFWNTQPVYHIYDFWRCLYSHPFYIYPTFHPSVRTRFCKPDIVDIIPFCDATDNDKQAFVNMIQCYSIADENTMCMFNLENLDTYFEGHLYGSYLSFYKDIFYNINDKNGNKDIVKSATPRGCISSRSGTFDVMGNLQNIYYIDFMTVVRDGDWLKLQREMFDTHIYKIGFIGWKKVYDSTIHCWLFKRISILLIGIVPLIRFQIQEYKIPNNHNFFKHNYSDHVVLTEINQQNIQKLINGLELTREKFEIFSITDISNLQGLIKKGVIYIYILERLGEVIAMYFFRDTRTRIEEYQNDGSVLELIGSVSINCSIQLFRNGFLGSIHTITTKYNLYKRLRTDNLTHNKLLDWTEWSSLSNTIGAYYTYNIIVPCTYNSIFILF